MSLFGPDKQAPTFYELAFSLIVIFSDLVLTGDTTDESFQSMNCRFISWRFFVWDLPQNRRFWARASRVAPTFCWLAFPYCCIFVLVFMGDTRSPLQCKIEDFGLDLQESPIHFMNRPFPSLLYFLIWSLRATQGRPYRVVNGLVGAVLFSPFAILNIFILGLWVLELFPV